MRVKEILLTGFGLLFLGLGTIGLFLPLLPTTPFVLASAACFSFNPAMRARLFKISFFKEHLQNYEQRKGLSNKTIAISLSYTWGMLILSMALIQKPWVSLLLFSVGAGVTIHILWMARAKRRKK